MTFADCIKLECTCENPMLAGEMDGYWKGGIECGNCGEQLSQKSFRGLMCD